MTSIATNNSMSVKPRVLGRSRLSVILEARPVGGVILWWLPQSEAPRTRLVALKLANDLFSRRADARAERSPDSEVEALID